LEVGGYKAGKRESRKKSEGRRREKGEPEIRRIRKLYPFQLKAVLGKPAKDRGQRVRGRGRKSEEQKIRG
jgi:hypothetical protein